MKTVRAELLHFDTVKDIDSKEPIPLYLFDEEIGNVELGLIVKYVLNYEKRNNDIAPPLANFLIGQLYEKKNIDLDSNKDVRQLKKSSRQLFGKDLLNALIDITQEYINDN